MLAGRGREWRGLRAVQDYGCLAGLDLPGVQLLEPVHGRLIVPKTRLVC